MRILILLSILTLCQSAMLAQPAYWQNVTVDRNSFDQNDLRETMPNQYKSLELNLDAFKTLVANAPMEYTPAAKNAPTIVSIPMPEGHFEDFEIFESPSMEAGITARYNIHSFKGRGVQQPTSVIRFDLSKSGFHAAIRTQKGMVYIDNYMQTRYYFKNPRDIYISYYTADYPHGQDLKCGVNDAHMDPLEHLDFPDQLVAAREEEGPVTMYVYRLALACVGEWGQNYGGGTVESALAIMNTAVNRLNLIFESEIALRLMLINNNDQCVMIDPDTDPYTNVEYGGFILGQSTQIMNSFVSPADYDIGHVFTTSCTGGLGGIAALGSVCGPNKGAGVSCLGGANVEGFMVSVTAHEIGHQLDAQHSFNYCDNENESAGSAYEPGSGSTIMSYAGACGPNNIAGTNDDYFHVNSLRQMYNFMYTDIGNNCGQRIATSNHFPTASIELEGGFYIPQGTPFQLTGSGADEDGDTLTYCWEQYDLGQISELGVLPTAPLFRSYYPSESPTRVFPKLTKLIQNNFDNKEILPTVDRPMTFRLTVRDNNPEGGVATWEEIAFNAVEAAGPFYIISPNAFDTFEAGSDLEITWDVANTNMPPVNCQHVHLKMSVDGGYTYPVTLAENVPNDGSQIVVVPDMPGFLNRIRVEAADNIFFDINNQNIEIAAASTAAFNFNVAPYAQKVCLPDASSISINTISLLNYDSPLTLSVTGLPDGATASFDSEVINPGENTVLHVDMNNSTAEGVFPVSVTATAADGSVQTKELLLELVSNDFSALSLLAPADGMMGITGNLNFSWATVEDADSYDIEIATSPAFGGSTIDVMYGTTIGEFSSQFFFEANTLYYWRVRPNNSCSPHPYIGPFAFHTTDNVCSPQTNSTPITIPANLSVGQSVDSEFSISENAIIDDLNVPNMNGVNDLVKHIKVSLISPANTEVILFEDLCGNSSVFNLGFDDESPTPVACPPNQGGIYTPQEALSAFDGENLQGNWKMRVTKIHSFSNGGSLQGWTIEACGQIAATPPVMVTNEPFPVNTGDSRVITRPFLEVSDPDNSITELTYTLVSNVEHGTLYLGIQPLTPGAQFDQGAINNFYLSYEHNGDANETDQFTFVVSDGTGGLIPTQTFQILIDDDAIYSGTTALTNNLNVRLYPNPANDLLNIAFEQRIKGAMDIAVYDISGKLMFRKAYAQPAKNISLATDLLASGLYFVKFTSEEGVFSKKFSIQR